MLKHKRIESFLPVFNGFYETVFAPDEDLVIESPYTYDNYIFDYDEYKERVAKAATNQIENKLAEILNNKGVTIGYENIVSPRFYNFETDSINVKYKLTTEAIKSINTYLKTNKEAFATYIKERYTSRDGFMSFYSNNANEWLNELLTDKKQLNHAFGAILEFIFENEGYNSYELYTDICDKCSLGGTLINGVGEINETIINYTKENYKTKDLITDACELANHFNENEIFEDFLTFDYIENLVRKEFESVDNLTLNLFAHVK